MKTLLNLVQTFRKWKHHLQRIERIVYVYICMYMICYSMVLLPSECVLHESKCIRKEHNYLQLKRDYGYGKQDTAILLTANCKLQTGVTGLGSLMCVYRWRAGPASSPPRPPSFAPHRSSCRCGRCRDSRSPGCYCIGPPASRTCAGWGRWGGRPSASWWSAAGRPSPPSRWGRPGRPCSAAGCSFERD